jgi:hypothetical protein
VPDDTVMTPPDAARRATDAPALAIPEGWVIDDSSRVRLLRILARLNGDIAAVVAERVDLEPGASYRTASERAALAAASARRPHAGREAAGAVLVRPGVSLEIGDASITVDGALLVDPGAVVHDPWRDLGSVESASSLGRPPFPWRPVVLFLGFEPDPDLADWVRSTVNGLVRGNTEGRIAVPEPTGGLHLTRPCAPTEQTVAALAPDAIVALDEEARTLGSQWLDGDRSAVIVEMTRDTTDAVELVSWRIGNAQGRVRARIGRGITAASLEVLVRRLGAGPQPLPPRDRKRGEVPAGRPRPVDPGHGALDPALRTVGLLREGSPLDDARYAAFADHAAAFGGKLTIGRVDGEVPDWAVVADIVLLRGLCSDPHASDLVQARRIAGRVTVVDLGPEDVEADTARTSGSPRLRPAAVELARACGHATTTSRRIHASLIDLGVRALVVPTLLTRARTSELRALRTRARRVLPPVLGWHTGSGSADPNGGHGAVARMLSDLLRVHPDVTVEVVGGAVQHASTLATHDRVTVAPGVPDIGTIARWTAQLWTTSSLEAELSGDVRPAVEAHYLGVPTLVAADNPAVREGLVVRDLAVDAATGWHHVDELLDDEVVWARRRDESIGLAEALYGPTSSLAVMNRLLGWLRWTGAA